MEDNTEKNTPISLIVVFILAVLIIGLLFLYRSDKVAKRNQEINEKEEVETAEELQEPEIELDAEIIAAERRDDNYYVQVQTNGTFGGTCFFALASSSDDDIKREGKLEPADRVSTCESEFPFEGLDSSEYNLTVLVETSSGAQKSLSKTVIVE